MSGIFQFETVSHTQKAVDYASASTGITIGRGANISLLRSLLSAAVLSGNKDNVSVETVIDLYREDRGLKPSTAKASFYRALDELVAANVFVKSVREDLPKLANFLHPSQYTLNSTTLFKRIPAAGRRSIAEVTIRDDHSKEPNTYRRASATALVEPVSMRLTTLLVSLGSRISKSDDRLEIFAPINLDGQDLRMRCYSTGRTGPNGKTLGRMHARDATILYLIQARDSQIVSEQIQRGIEVKNQFRLDAYDIARELYGCSTNAEVSGSRFISVSTAILRIAEMNFEAEVEPGSPLAMALSEKYGGPRNRVRLRHLEIKATGDSDSNSNVKYQRFFTYEHPEHVFEAMRHSRGMYVFDPDLLPTNVTGYEGLLYFWLRHNVRANQERVVTLHELFTDPTCNPDGTWKTFSNGFLKSICSLAGSEKVLRPSEVIEAEFLGYYVKIYRPSVSLESIQFLFRGRGVRRYEILTADKNGGQKSLF